MNIYIENKPGGLNIKAKERFPREMRVRVELHDRGKFGRGGVVEGVYNSVKVVAKEFDVLDGTSCELMIG